VTCGKREAISFLSREISCDVHQITNFACAGEIVLLWLRFRIVRLCAGSSSDCVKLIGGSGNGVEQNGKEDHFGLFSCKSLWFWPELGQGRKYLDMV